MMLVFALVVLLLCYYYSEELEDNYSSLALSGLMISDAFSLIWFCIGAFVIANLVDCPDLGVAVFGIILLALHVVLSGVIAVVLLCE